MSAFYLTPINTFGHDIGDQVLQQTAKIVKNIIRNSDYFIRWGGEEFMILCPETNINNTLTLAEKIRSAIDTACFPEVKHITVSLGVTTFIKDDNIKSFTKRVDEALYEAKESGRNIAKKIIIVEK
jgi:diguanylate cyclase (GGDEF)-like protein